MVFMELKAIRSYWLLNMKTKKRCKKSNILIKYIIKQFIVVLLLNCMSVTEFQEKDDRFSQERAALYI